MMRESVCGVVINGTEVYVAKRLPDARYPDTWEFPGGKVEPGETPEEAIVREWEEEFNLEIEVDQLLSTLHGYQSASGHIYTIYLYKITVKDWEKLQLNVHSDAKWIDVIEPPLDNQIPSLKVFYPAVQVLFESGSKLFKEKIK